MSLSALPLNISKSLVSGERRDDVLYCGSSMDIYIALKSYTMASATRYSLVS